ncbi:pyridoxal phosphate-dependent transferase [Bisporella sp. PMI_857]|nr:pyridoxal phosphate-dependent transferase [Bisporella sp. PMI_857]
MSSIFHRSLTKSYPEVVAGDGPYLITSDGQRVLDGSSGAAVSCLGHSNSEVVDAIVSQARTLPFAHTSFFTNRPSELLAKLLIEQSDSAFEKVIFLSSGSEAVESSIKLARQYHNANNQPNRVNFIARQSSYHGNTLGALSAGHNPPRREPFAPILSPAFHHTLPCFYSRDGKPNETEDEYVYRLMAALETQFQELGPSTIAAVIVEPVSGSTLGGVAASPVYLSRLHELCNKHGALLIFDEVMCGMGRAGTLHAWQSLGNVKPDLQTIGKGLAAGYQPLSAVLVSGKVHSKLLEEATTKPFLSGHTYQGHAIACAAGLATQKYLIERNLLENVRNMGELLVTLLKAALPKNVVKEIRGVGLFRGVEFQPVDPSGSQIAKEVAALTFEKGAAVYLCSSAVDAVLFAPPFIINKRQVEELATTFNAAVREVLTRRGISSK